MAIADLDELIDRFRATGHPVEEASCGFMDVIAASEVARWPVMDIVRAVLVGSMPSVELLPGSLGFRSVLVHPRQVKRVLSLQEAQSGLSPQEVAQRLGIYTSGVTHLRKISDREGRPLLSAVATANPRGTIHYRFPPEEVARFAREYVKLGDLASERRVSSRAMSRAPAEADIQPIARRHLLNAAYYRRADL